MKSGGPSWPNSLSSPPRWCPWDLFRSFKVYSDDKERVGCGKQREATAPIKSLVKLQPWFLSLRWKTCLRQNCSIGFSASSEGPAFGKKTDDDIRPCGKQREATAPIKSCSKTEALVPGFEVEDLPSTELQPRFLRLQWRTCFWAEYSYDDIRPTSTKHLLVQYGNSGTGVVSTPKGRYFIRWTMNSWESWNVTWFNVRYVSDY